jgi:pimeloyl-ACP methyl ester carboxylesterase
VTVGEHRMTAWGAGVEGDTGLPTVVCVHGAGVSSRPMMRLVRRLGAETAVWTVDLPGFGKSSKPPRPLGLAGLADALAGWLAAMDIADACLLGSSFGCQIATDVAVRHGDRVAALVLSGPTTDPTARSWHVTLGRWLRNHVRESPRMFPLNLADYRDCGTRRMFATFAASLKDRIDLRLPRIGVPALVVRGERDTLAPQAWAEEVTRLLPEGRLATVPGAPHMIPFKNPEALAGLVTDFLAQEAVHVR